MTVQVSVDGRLLAVDDARISPFDHGLLVGDGVFETLRVYAGVPFAWTRHLDRLHHSAAGLGLDVPDGDDLRRRADDVLSANGLTEARLRITITGGPSPLGSERGDTAPTVIVAAAAAAAWPPTTALVTVPWPRNERGAVTGLKTISYAENVRALAFASERGGGEALFLNTVGDVCEGTGANLFAVVDGELFTPPAASGCLLGVTRALVLEIAASTGIGTSTGRLEPSTLLAADEVFITSSTREIQPVDRVDGTEFAVPGPITRHLAEAFTELVRTTPDP